MKALIIRFSGDNERFKKKLEEWSKEDNRSQGNFIVNLLKQYEKKINE